MIEPIIQEMFGKIYTEPKGPKMYVAGNESKNYGAAVILYENFLANFARKMQCNFYILPSSIHEVILLPVENENDDISRLKEMVYEVNHTELSEEEILSDSLYMFNWENGNIIKLQIKMTKKSMIIQGFISAFYQTFIRGCAIIKRMI